MGDYSLVRNRNGNVEGFWLKDPENWIDDAHKGTKRYNKLVFLAMKESIPEEIHLKIMSGDFQMYSNTTDDKGGVFVMFDTDTNFGELGEKRPDIMDKYKPTLTVGRVQHTIIKTPNEIGEYAIKKKPCVLRTSFGEISNDHIAALHRAKEESIFIDHEKQVRVQCVTCNMPLSNEAFNYLILANAPFIMGMAGVVSNSNLAREFNLLIKEGKCPKCKGKDCYYIFSPNSFESKEYLETKEKKWWQFCK